MLLYIFVITFIIGHKSIAALSKDTNCGPRLPLIVNGSNTYYFGLITKVTAIQAEAICRSFNMDLVSIETPEEHAFLEESLLSYMDLNSKNWTALWTSGKKLDEDKWTWGATGMPVHYTNWWAEKPDNIGGTENCLNMWYKQDYPGQIKWNDSPCDAAISYFICEYNNNGSDEKSKFDVTG